MDYLNHVKFNISLIFLASIYAAYTNFLNFHSFLKLWAGVVPYTFLITCDLDSSTSLVTKLWGPFKFIWRPFVDAGHREILHSIGWGPFILITPVWLILRFKFGIDVWEESIIGAVLALWGHILADKIYSNILEIKKIKIVKWVRRVF